MVRVEDMRTELIKHRFSGASHEDRRTALRTQITRNSGKLNGARWIVVRALVTGCKTR